jgi:hypothetical protein
MKAVIFALASGLSLGAQHATQPTYSEQRLVEYAKSVNVHALDASLPSQRLEDWLQFGPPRARVVYWEPDTCDLKPDGIADYPLCVKIGFFRGSSNKGGYLLVQVGTINRGISGSPHLYSDIAIVKRDDPLKPTGVTDKLSGISELLN